SALCYDLPNTGDLAVQRPGRELHLIPRANAPVWVECRNREGEPMQRLHCFWRQRRGHTFPSEESLNDRALPQVPPAERAVGAEEHIARQEGNRDFNPLPAVSRLPAPFVFDRHHDLVTQLFQPLFGWEFLLSGNDGDVPLQHSRRSL